LSLVGGAAAIAIVAKKYDLVHTAQTALIKEKQQKKTMASLSADSDEEFPQGMATGAAAGFNMKASPNVAKKMPGRPKTDDIWHHVSRTLEPDGSTYKQVCQHCGKTRNSAQFQSTFWSTHLVGLCDKAPMEVRRAIAVTSKSKEVKRLAGEAGVLDLTMLDDDEQPNSNKKQKTLAGYSYKSPHKSRSSSKVKLKIDKLTERYVSELKALKALASMSDDPAVYDEGARILNLIGDVEQSRKNNGI
jgi:hypothetical protein